MPKSTGVTVAILLAGILVILAGIAISLYYGKRAKSAADWLSARESLPLPVVVITQFAAAAGGGVLVAHVGIAYAKGWAVFVYELCVCAGFVLLALLAKWLRANGFSTLPDVLARLYGNDRTQATLAGLAALFLPFGWVCTQFSAFASLFGQVTGYPKAVLIAVILIGSVAFVLPGGLTSVAWTDFFFGIVKIVLALGLAGYCVHLAGGWHSIVARVPAGFTDPSSMGRAGQAQIWLWIAAIIPSTLLIGLSVRALKPGLSPESAAGWLLTQLPPAVLIVFGAFMVAMIVSVSGAARWPSATRSPRGSR